jgi:hypothetical protein
MVAIPASLSPTELPRLQRPSSAREGERPWPDPGRVCTRPSAAPPSEFAAEVDSAGFIPWKTDRMGKMKLLFPIWEEPGDKGPLAMGEKVGEYPLSLLVGVEVLPSPPPLPPLPPLPPPTPGTAGEPGRSLLAEPGPRYMEGEGMTTPCGRGVRDLGRPSGK